VQRVYYIRQWLGLGLPFLRQENSIQLPNH